MRVRNARLATRAAGAVVCLAAAACGGGAQEHQKVEAAADSMAVQHDSAVHQMDSGRAAGQVDTTKLGAAKTESILTSQRKKP